MTNTGAQNVTVTSLTDDIYGNLSRAGDVRHRGRPGADRNL